MKTITNPNNPNRMLVKKALGYNDWGYDNLIHQFFVTWCEAMALKFYHKDRDLISNESLFAYYNKQWQILVENRMVNEYGGYMMNQIQDSAKTYYKFLYDFAMELENYYPASLIRTVKPKERTKPKYQFNLN
ncbi:hypothetical protein [Chryseobacterium koreense]|uniref:Uncharacterized protein n=1 Tax=Chryseobacterium koreense CCUG 49689 TaxID=1304281 RepID=A0A0J7IT34_9FLAO|nr:hypothetical protein [Chryseobacterium koreense]KMQ69067.1 hypothetical protein ACM44_14580 [Chryseobacterium koreense CCUG 49689]MBB5334598.1 hypothetical protein [Chryseobacterium koreense]